MLALVAFVQARLQELNLIAEWTYAHQNGERFFFMLYALQIYFTHAKTGYPLFESIPLIL